MIVGFKFVREYVTINPSKANSNITIIIIIIIINPDSFDTDDKWVERWEKVVHLRGKLYLLPGGAVGRKLVSL